MTRNRTIAAQVVLIVALSFAAFALAATRAHASTAPELSQATQHPTVLRYLLPGQSTTIAHGRNGYNCAHGWFSNVQVYRWDGSGLTQHRFDDAIIWRRPGIKRQYVSFDGITFYNDTRIAVLVAGWCD